MVDSTPLAILGSVALAVIVYWLNGWSERNLERRKVNYSSKLKSFELFNAQIAIAEEAFETTQELAQRLFSKDGPPIDRNYLTTVLAASVVPDLPDELKRERAILEGAWTRLDKLGDALSPEVRQIAHEMLFSYIDILWYYTKKLSISQFNLRLISETTDVHYSFVEFLKALKAGLKAIRDAPDSKEDTSTLKRQRGALVEASTHLHHAMRYELETTMLSWYGKMMANRAFHRDTNSAKNEGT